MKNKGNIPPNIGRDPRRYLKQHTNKRGKTLYIFYDGEVTSYHRFVFSDEKIPSIIEAYGKYEKPEEINVIEPPKFKGGRNYSLRANDALTFGYEVTKEEYDGAFKE